MNTNSLDIPKTQEKSPLHGGLCHRLKHILIIYVPVFASESLEADTLAGKSVSINISFLIVFICTCLFGKLSL